MFAIAKHILWRQKQVTTTETEKPCSINREGRHWLLAVPLRVLNNSAVETGRTGFCVKLRRVHSLTVYYSEFSTIGSGRSYCPGERQTA